MGTSSGVPSVLVLHGPNRAEHFEEIDSHDLVLTAKNYAAVILDEIQAIKNPKSNVSPDRPPPQAPHAAPHQG